MYKAAVIGDRESVMGFRALGLSAITAKDAEEARTALHRLANDNYGIIYITEQLAAQIGEDIAEYIENPQCAIIPIPSKSGSLGIGDKEMHKAVERAVGADILR